MKSIIKIKNRDTFTQLVYLIKYYFTEIDNEKISDIDAINFLNDLESKLDKYSGLVLEIAEEDGKIVGFLLGNLNYNYNKTDCGFILELFVLKKHRKNGIGRDLVTYFEKQVDLNIIYLTSNNAATKFYKSIGYKTYNCIDLDNGNIIYFKELG